MQKFIKELHYLANSVNKKGNLDTREGQTAYPIIQSMIPWTEKIYDMSPEQIQEYKSAFIEKYNSDEQRNSTRNVVDIFYLEYQYFQVRKDYNWVMDQYKLSGDKMAVRREILLQRLRGSTNSPIAPEDIEYLISHMMKSTRDLLIDNKWRFRLYDHGQGRIMSQLKELDENIPYLVGIDPAAGGGGDNAAIVMVNPYNLQVAAEFKNPYISGTDLCKLLVTLVRNYAPKSVLIPEKNSMGIYLIQMICDHTSIKENLYWSESARQLENLVEESAEDYNLKIASEAYKKYGTYLTKKVRDAMFELLFKHVNECKQLLNTEYLVDDICKLVRTSTGKIEAVKGQTDDILLAYLHALYIYYTGDNLEIFGITKHDHPILGPIEIGVDNNLLEKEILNPFFSTEKVTYETIARQETMKQEEQVKYMVELNPHVYDSVYSRIKEKKHSLYDETVDILPYYFDMVNNTEGEI
jgi:hypothetical protein